MLCLVKIMSTKTVLNQSLVIGEVYQCRLSGRKVYISNIYNEEIKMPDGRLEVVQNIDAIVYNSITGFYDSFIVHDKILQYLEN